MTLRCTVFTSLAPWTAFIPAQWMFATYTICLSLMTVTLTYLFSTKVTHSIKVTFFALCLIDLWENQLGYQTYFNGQLLGKFACVQQWHTNWPLPIWGLIIWKKITQNGILYFNIIRLFEIVRIKKSIEKVIRKCVHEKGNTIFQIRCFFTYTHQLVTAPLLLPLHVWNILAQLVTSSPSLTIFWLFILQRLAMD